MSIDKNNENLGTIKDSVDLGHTMDPIGQSAATVESTKQDFRALLEQELIKRLSREKHRLAAEMEIKFKEAGIKRVQAQELKLKEIIAQEREKFKAHLAKEKQQYEIALQQQEKVLKDKYSRVMKSMVQEREQKIAEEYQKKVDINKQQNYASDVELRAEIEKYKQELMQAQQTATLQIAEAKLTAKQEQEKASRNLYENVLKANREEIIKQTEDKLQAEFLRKEVEARREHEINLKKHTAKLMTAYEEKLNEALFEQEQAFARTNNDQLTKQSELFNHRIKSEIDTAVSAATSKLELEFVKEKQALNVIIENMRPEIEANRLRMRVEVEKELREEYEIKFSHYKHKVDQAKALEVESLVTTEKQRLSESMQEENMVVLKYKEREILERCNTEAQRDLQLKIQQSLSEQEKRLRAEHQQQLEQAINKLQSDHSMQLQAEVIQERSRVADKATNEKKILLQQQQINLEEQFNSELTHKLAMQAQSLTQQHQIEICSLEAKIQELQNQQNIKQAHEQALAITQQRIPQPRMQLDIQADNPYLVSASTMYERPASEPDHSGCESEKRSALREQEQRLRSEYEQKLRDVRSTIEHASRGIDPEIHEAEIHAMEQKLRREFQGILEQQRMQAATNFAKQRDIELRETIAKYKQKIINEMDNARVNDLAAAEEALKEQYAARMQQHSDLARIEIERTKDKLLSEQAERIQHAVGLQLEVIHKEQERKFAAYAAQQDERVKVILAEEQQKLNLKFAQDKANLIKDLTAKFTREKHIAMNKYETELREKLYSEMVKQKEFIQTKFTQTQESALNEQKRRLEAQHKHEIERIKQGFFDPSHEASPHAEIIAERNVELLADKILAKFQK